MIDDEVYENLANDPYLARVNFLDNLRKHSSGCAVFQKTWKKADGGYKTETIYLHKLVAERFLKDEIFNPLQIIDSEMETLANSSEQWAKGYGLDRGVKELFVEPEKYPMPYAAGGLRSTVKDLLLLMKGLNDGTLLSKELRDKMTQYAKVNSGEDINDIVNFYFPKDFVLPERPEYLGKYGYGLGFQRMEIFSTDAIWHGGGIAGFQTALIHIPDNGVTLSILTNAGIPGGYSTIWKEVQCLITAIE